MASYARYVEVIVNEVAKGKWGRTETSSLVKLAIILVLMGVFLFWPAGTLDWAAAWLFLAGFLGLIVVAMVYLWRVNPEIFAARASFGKGTKSWDYFVVTIALLAFFAVLPVAGLDRRWTGAALPAWTMLLGTIALLLGFAVTAWAQGVNRHFEPTVRIQSERGHGVISSGPYSFVRHPGYVAGSGMILGMALVLGSLWALVPAAIATATLMVRTLLEERTLLAELPGYREYAERVRFRWIPGLW